MMNDKTIKKLLRKLSGILSEAKVTQADGVSLLISLAFDHMLILRDGSIQKVKEDMGTFVDAYMRNRLNPTAYDINDSGDEQP